MAKLTGRVSSTVLGDVDLRNGRHYWKVRVDQFSGGNNNGYIAVGVATSAEQGRMIGKAYAGT